MTQNNNMLFPAEEERAVLGAMLIDNDSVFDIVTMLKPSDFYDLKHRAICEAIFAVHHRREPIDLLVVCAELERRGKLKTVGGPAYVAELISAVPSALNAAAYARIVKTTSQRRALRDVAVKIAELTTSEEEPVQAAAQIISELSSIAIGIGKRTVLTMSDVANSVIDEVLNGDDSIPTGFGTLNLMRGQITLVAARPGIGKSTFLQNVAQYVAKSGKHVVFVTLEMSPEEIMRRMLTAEGYISNARKIREDELDNFFRGLGELEQLPLSFIYDSLTISEICAQIEALHARKPVDLVVVDYIQLVRSSTRQNTRTDEISEVVVGLIGLAIKTNAAILCAAQFNRAMEQRSDSTPLLSDLGESGSLERNASMVLAIHNNDYTAQTVKPGQIIQSDILVLKNRHGPLYKFTLGFMPAKNKFVNLHVEK